MNRKLTQGQATTLILAALPMLAFGIMGGVGTYANIMEVFDRSATALGVLAAGEGATFVLASVMVGLTMLGQSSPAMVRLGLWALPTIASAVGAYVAPSGVESVVYALTPMAMCVSAEGLGLLARRIVVYRTGVDMEAQRRNAATLRKLAYHSARSNAQDVKPKIRERSARTAWRLARKVGAGDVQLGAGLVEVQRDRMTQGADSALLAMYGLTTAVRPALPAGQTDTRTDKPEAGQTDTRTDKPEAGQTDKPEAGQTDKPEAGQTDTRTDKPEAGQTDTRTDKPEAGQTDSGRGSAGDLVQRQNVSAFVRGLLTENPDITDNEIKDRIRTDFGMSLGTPAEQDRARKAIVRARARMAS